METESYTRPIISFLKEINERDLYISGKCVLLPLRFRQFFINTNSGIPYRPIFLLKPENSNVKLILIMDGEIKDFGGGKYLSKDNKTICFNNTLPLMYIFKISDFKEYDLKKILNSAFLENGVYNNITSNSGFGDEIRICKKIVDIGFIQSSVVSAIFTATFDHEDSCAGRFTLLFK